MESYGNFSHQITENKTEATVNLQIDFDLPAKLKSLILDSIQSHTITNDMFDLSQPRFEKYLTHQMGFNDMITFVGDLRVGKTKCQIS